jgi:hypothetical protein
MRGWMEGCINACALITWAHAACTYTRRKEATWDLPLRASTGTNYVKNLNKETKTMLKNIWPQVCTCTRPGLLVWPTFGTKLNVQTGTKLKKVSVGPNSEKMSTSIQLLFFLRKLNYTLSDPYFTCHQLIFFLSKQTNQRTKTRLDRYINIVSRLGFRH